MGLNPIAAGLLGQGTVITAGALGVASAYALGRATNDKKDFRWNPEIGVAGAIGLIGAAALGVAGARLLFKTPVHAMGNPDADVALVGFSVLAAPLGFVAGNVKGKHFFEWFFRNNDQG